MFSNTYWESSTYQALNFQSFRDLVYQIFQEKTYSEVTVEHLECNFRRVVINKTKLEGIKQKLCREKR